MERGFEITELRKLVRHLFGRRRNQLAVSMEKALAPLSSPPKSGSGSDTRHRAFYSGCVNTVPLVVAGRL